jgi:hypothetical protein
MHCLHAVVWFRVKKASITTEKVPLHLRNATGDWPIQKLDAFKTAEPDCLKARLNKRQLDMLADTGYEKQGRCKDEPVRNIYKHI